jgi:prevent-host-death family protein
MDKTIDVAELKKDIEYILDEVTIARTPYVLTREARPSAVLIAYEDYVKLLSREEIWARFKKTWTELGEKNAQYSDEEIAADVELATKEVRERRERKT